MLSARSAGAVRLHLALREQRVVRQQVPAARLHGRSLGHLVLGGCFDLPGEPQVAYSRAPRTGKSPVTAAGVPWTPAFEASVDKTRRDEVLRRMREMASGAAIAIFPAMPVATRNSDVEHPYRAHSDLYWLTGF